MVKTKNKKSLEIDSSKFQIVIKTDGACEGNPGRIGVGGIIQENFPAEKILKKFSKSFIYGTNNEAEYFAIITSLMEFIELNIKADSILILSDSQVVIKQLHNENSFSHAKLAKLKCKVMKIVENIPCDVQFKWIPRDRNREADELASMAINS